MGDELIEGGDITPEKLERIKGKFETFLADVSSDLLDEETIKKVGLLARKKLKDEGIIVTLSHLKALRIGFGMGMSNHEAGVSVPFMTALTKIIADEQKKVDDKVAKSMGT